MYGAIMGSMMKMGKPLGKFAKIGMKGKKFFGSIGKAFKNKSVVKAATDFFKEVQNIMKGPLGGITSLIEALGILDPMFKVFASVIKIFTGSFLITMLPVFMRWLDIITDPKYQAAVRALGAAMANLWIPSLHQLVDVLEKIDWVWWKDFWNWVGGGGEIIVAFSDKMGQLNTIALVAVKIWEKLIDIFFKIDYVMVGGSLVPSFILLYNALKAIEVPLNIFTNFINQIKTLASNLPSIGGGFGGGGGGGGGGGFIRKTVKKAKSYLGLQNGTDYIPSDQWRFLHKGEGVKPAKENLIMSGQLETMISLQEESNNRQERMFKFMRYGV